MDNYLSEERRHDLCLIAIGLKKNIEVSFLELGGALHEIKERRHYEAGWSSWEEYLLELKISQSMVSRLIRIYEVFVLKYEFAPRQIAEAGGWTTVAQLLPEIKEDTPKLRVNTWLTEMIGLTRSDALGAIKDRKRGYTAEECEPHDTYTIKICRKCGERWKL
jgi:hypothetical protein